MLPGLYNASTGAGTITLAASESDNSTASGDPDPFVGSLDPNANQWVVALWGAYTGTIEGTGRTAEAEIDSSGNRRDDFASEFLGGRVVATSIAALPGPITDPTSVIRRIDSSSRIDAWLVAHLILTGVNGIEATNGDSDTNGGTMSASVNTVSGGFVAAVFCGRITGSVNWTNATELYSYDNGGEVLSVAYADDANGLPLTISAVCSNGSTGDVTSLSLISFN